MAGEFLKSEGFKAVSEVPGRRSSRKSWAVKVLDDFLASNDQIVVKEFESSSTTSAKAAALRKTAQAEPYQGKVNVERRGLEVYLEKVKKKRAARKSKDSE